MISAPPKALTCGEAIVGFIKVTNVDNYWTIGELKPGPAYQQYAALFDRERELSQRYGSLADDAGEEEHSAAHDGWMAALEAINDLGLCFDGAPVRDFKIGSRGECEFKLEW